MEVSGISRVDFWFFGSLKLKRYTRLFYDPAKSRVYVVARTAAGGDQRAPGPGMLEIFQLKNPNHYEKVGTQPTGFGAQTGFFSPALGKLFVATRRQQSGASGEILVYNTK